MGVHLTHKTRISDSSLYDEVCTVCGRTDGQLAGRCPGMPHTRNEARARGVPHYYTGLPCRNGHVALRYKDGSCTECMKYHRKRWLKENPDQRREKERRYREAHSEELKLYQRQWRASNPDKIKEYNRKRRRKARNQATPQEVVEPPSLPEGW